MHHDWMDENLPQCRTNELCIVVVVIFGYNVTEHYGIHRQHMWMFKTSIQLLSFAWFATLCIWLMHFCLGFCSFYFVRQFSRSHLVAACYCLVFPNFRLSAWLMHAHSVFTVFIYNYQLFYAVVGVGVEIVIFRALLRFISIQAE